MIFGKNKKTEDLMNSTKSVEEAALNRWRSINNNGNISTGNTLAKDSNYNEQIEASELIYDENLEYLEELDLEDITSEETSSEEINTNSEISLKLTAKDEIPLVNLDTVFEDSPVNSNSSTSYSSLSSNPSKIKNTPVVPVGDFSVNYEEDLKNRFGSDLKSALGTGTVIEGIFSFDSPVRIDGVLKGEIRSNSALIVGKKAKVHANIKVGSLIVLGTVQGEVEADDLIEIRSSGQLMADITTTRLALEEGGVFSGSCSMI